jgi:protein-disulfide isomerase
MTTHPAATLVLPVTERDHIRGSLTAPVTMVEYGDFECPHCGRAYPIVESIIERAGRVLCFAYRHFPLANIHPHAERAAEAAEAAGAQGRFWAMHHRLFEHQDALDDESLVMHARAIGLDLQRFAVELANGVHMPRVREDFLSGVRSGVNGTPTFFINGVRHDGAWDQVSLLQAIEEALETAKGAA